MGANGVDGRPSGAKPARLAGEFIVQVRQFYPVAAALIAGLPLVSCSGPATSEESGGAARGIQAGGQDTMGANGGPSGRSPNASTPSTGDGIERPDIEVADTLELAFEAVDNTTDPVERAVLDDNEWQIKSVYEVLTTHDTENSSIGFYTRGAALVDAIEMIEAEMEDGRTFTGTMEFFDREVTSVNGDAALVSYCRDITGVSPMDFETGEVWTTPDVEIPPAHYISRLERNDFGVWQTVSTEIEEEAPQCQ